MRNKIIVANQKMLVKSFDEVKNFVYNFKYKDKVIICPSSIYLQYFAQNGYNIAIQNIHFEDSGSYTGEISINQAKDIGVSYTIIGHSERRKYFNETDEIINKKIKSCIKNNMNFILCIGENLLDYKSGKSQEAIKNQLIKAFDGIEIPRDAIIAYEPTWSIGTGEALSVLEIESIVGFIRDFINDNFKKSVKVLYGGSVSDDNIEEIKKVVNIDGILVGETSVFSSKLSKVVEVVSL
ncbi:MAG: triose-phosphate isomerase [Clostridium sp.]|nr:triose-phosphate isomerase [Clostridium sp.]MCM1444142.1 triose-phosphate isomerase [Candidatus Amulumruptor caecigallinarius]